MFAFKRKEGEMFGNLLNNTLIRDLIEHREIIISPQFDPARLQIAQYPLFPYSVHKVLAKGKMKQVHLFSEDGDIYSVEPNDYIIVDMLEIIQLPIGIVGRFIPASSLIERGFGLTAGKIEHPFCHNQERIRFGLKNYLDQPNPLIASEQLAYIQFFDLRGMDIDRYKYELSQRDRQYYKGRKDDNIDQ